MALTKVDISMLEDISAGTKIVAVAPSTSGNVLTSDGTNWASSAAAGGGKMVQVVNVQNGAGATGTTIMPDDDTIPQITEGDEYMTLAITPTNSSNKLLIEVVLNGDAISDKTMIVALFQGTTANALACGNNSRDGASIDVHQVTFSHFMTAGTTSATTFRVRMGGAGSGTADFNGLSGTRKMGGVMASSITITEIEV